MKTDARKNIPTRRILVIAGLLILYVALTCLVFVLGKGHTVIVDNRNSGALIASKDGFTVSVNGSEPVEMYPGDRIQEKTKGQGITITVETFSGQKTEKRFTIPLLMDTILVSIPKMTAGTEPYFEVFTPTFTPPPANEASGDNSFTSPDAIIPDAPIAVPAP